MRAPYLLAVAALSAFAFGQAPAFEVASVKINKSGEPSAYGQESLASGRFNFLNTRMRDLIMWAYDVRRDYITGGPGWIDSERYDVVGQAPSNTPLPQVRLMLQTLLADRFNLVAHEIRKTVPVFALMVGRAARPLLNPAAGSGQAECHPGHGAAGLVHVECANLTLEDLADYLPDLAPGYIDRPVIDLTQIQGTYDFKLDWAPQPPAARGSTTPSSTPDLSAGPTIFDELQQRFGLRLEAKRRSMPIIVIDHVERNPAGN